MASWDDSTALSKWPVADRATTRKSTGHSPFYMAHDLTLSIFLVPNLANPLSTAKLIAARIRQLQRRENDLVAIHANMGH